MIELHGQLYYFETLQSNEVGSSSAMGKEGLIWTLKSAGLWLGVLKSGPYPDIN